MSEIIRAYQLTRGCIFIKQGTTYKIWKVDDSKIHFRYYGMESKQMTGEYRWLGKNSSEKIKLIEGEPNIHGEESK